MIVVKTGGRAVEKNLEGILEWVSRKSKSCKIVLVHGGGDQVTRMSKALGIEPRFVISPQGIRSRYTSREELEIFTMVMSMINREIVAKLASKGVRSMGIAGCDGSSLAGSRKRQIVVLDERGRKRVIEGGYTGKIESCKRSFIEKLLDLVDVLVISPLVLDPSEGVLLNTDGDEAAAAVATCIGAKHLVFLTDVPGVVVEGKVLKEIKASCSDVIEKVGAGMNRKILAATRYVMATGGTVYICDGSSSDPGEKIERGECTAIKP